MPTRQPTPFTVSLRNMHRAGSHAISHEPGMTSGYRRRRTVIPFRCFHAQQIVNEEVEALELAVSAARSMTSARYDQQVEVLLRLYQRIDDLHRRRWIHVRIHLTNDEQQLALQSVRVVHVGRRCVLRPDWPSHPLLVPPDLVHPVVVRARSRNGGLVELRMKEQCAQWALAPG